MSTFWFPQNLVLVYSSKCTPSMLIPQKEASLGTAVSTDEEVTLSVVLLLVGVVEGGASKVFRFRSKPVADSPNPQAPIKKKDSPVDDWVDGTAGHNDLVNCTGLISPTGWSSG